MIFAVVAFVIGLSSFMCWTVIHEGGTWKECLKVVPIMWVIALTVSGCWALALNAIINRCIFC